MNMYKTRTKLIYLEERAGIEKLSEPTKLTFSFIQHYKRTSVCDMIKHPFFMDLSLSTIKRAVGTLLKKELIVAVQSESDRRRTILTTIM